MEGWVLDRVYLGTDTACHVSVVGDLVLVARDQNADIRGRGHAVGEAVHLDAAPRALRMLEDRGMAGRGRANGASPASRPGQRERDHRSFRGWPGVAPSLLIIGVFMLAPIGIIAVYSLLEADPCGGVRPDFSPEAYLQLIFERDLDDRLVCNDACIDIFLRSVLLAGAAAGLCLLIGFPVAWYMATQPPERRTLLVFPITIPFWTNLLIRTCCWILVLRNTGSSTTRSWRSAS